MENEEEPIMEKEFKPMIENEEEPMSLRERVDHDLASKRTLGIDDPQTVERILSMADSYFGRVPKGKRFPKDEMLAQIGAALSAYNLPMPLVEVLLERFKGKYI